MEAQFLEQGYLIVRECIPPAELGRVRGLVDRFFEHAREDFGDDTGCGPSHGRLKQRLGPLRSACRLRCALRNMIC